MSEPASAATAPGGRPIAPPPTATWARSCLTKDGSTRPRRTCSGRVACGVPPASDRPWPSSTCCSRGLPRGAVCAPMERARSRTQRTSCADPESTRTRPLPRRWSPRPTRSRAIPIVRCRSRGGELAASERHRPLLHRVSGIALARLGRSDEAETRAAKRAVFRSRGRRRLRGRRHHRGARFAWRRVSGHAARTQRDHRAAEDRAAAGSVAQLSPPPRVLAGYRRDQHPQHRVLAGRGRARLGEHARVLLRID